MSSPSQQISVRPQKYCRTCCKPTQRCLSLLWALPKHARWGRYRAGESRFGARSSRFCTLWPGRAPGLTRLRQISPRDRGRGDVLLEGARSGRHALRASGLTPGPPRSDGALERETPLRPLGAAGGWSSLLDSGQTYWLSSCRSAAGRSALAATCLSNSSFSR